MTAADSSVFMPAADSFRIVTICSSENVFFRTLEWIDRFNDRRLPEPIGDIPPAEYEMLYWTGGDGTDTVGLTEPSLQ